MPCLTGECLQAHIVPSWGMVQAHAGVKGDDTRISMVNIDEVNLYKLSCK